MKVKQVLLSMAFLMMTGMLFGQSTQWNFDKSHSKVQFTATHMKISEVAGQFKEYSGTILTDGDNFSDAKIKVNIKASSVDTDNDRRDGHLQGEDFFNTEKYPNITFVSESMEKVDDQEYKLTGELTIKDVTRIVELDVDYRGMVEAMGATRAGFKITGTIDRFDYNVDWDKSFGKGLIVGRDIGINIDVELIRAE